MRRTFRLGTRGSPLALIQARLVAAAIEAAEGWREGEVDIAIITTSGDRITDRPLAEVGGKGLWTKEIDLALMAGEIDFAVHSIKDVEVVRPAEIRLAAIRPRTHVEDRLIGAQSIDALKQGAVIGTSSPRRAAQMLAARPDFTVVPIRGNVETRLRKLEQGDVDATILSSAGLHRLGMDHVGAPIPFDIMLPAPGQGAMGTECRADDRETVELLRRIDDPNSHFAVLAERAFTRALGGSCHSPVAALATVVGGQVSLRAEILSEDGTARVRDEAGFAAGGEEAPARLAREMLGRAPASVRSVFKPQ